MVMWTLALSTVLLGLVLIITGKLQVRQSCTNGRRAPRETFSLYKNTSVFVECRPDIIPSVVRVCSQVVRVCSWVCIPCGPIQPNACETTRDRRR